MSEAQEKKILYENEGSQYEVSKFSKEGKTFLRYLIETNQEIKTMQKRIDILQAAGITLSNKIKEQLTNDMLASLGGAIEADELVNSEDLQPKVS